MQKFYRSTSAVRQRVCISRSFLKMMLSIVLVLGVPVGIFPYAPEAGTIKGTVTASANSQKTTIEGATLTLVNKATPKQPLTTVSNATGDFIFENLPAGEYILTIDAKGLSSIKKEIMLASGAMLVVDIDVAATVDASVTIHDEEGLLSTSDTTTSNVVRVESLKSQPLRTDNYQNAIQLTPGSVRDAAGNDHLKGTRAGQSGYTVNGADVTDPVTGRLAFDIPIEAAQSVQIEENPYSSEFGRFTGGLTNLQTRGGGEKFSFSVARFVPTFHNIFSTTIDSFRPRITFSGPIIKKRLYFLQSFEYRFSRAFVAAQPKPNDNIVQEGFNSFTQLDLNINKNNVLKFNAAVFPQRFRNLGLDTFNTAASTPNYKQRGMLLSVSEQSVFKDTSFLSSEISYKSFDVDVFGKSTQPFTVAPETNSGGYFANTSRRTSRTQWQETYYGRPVKLYGEHAVKAGFELDHTHLGGQLNFSSIFIRRLNNTLAQRIDFTAASPLDYTYKDISAFVQDKWKIDPKLIFDFGIRYDRDGVTKRNNIAPRFAFMFLPLKDERTILRGGVGLFYDRSLAGEGNFDLQPNGAIEQVPQRIVTTYAADGVTVTDGLRRFDNVNGTTLKSPRSVRWNLQLDRGINKEITVRVGILERMTKHDRLLEPVIGPGNTGMLQLNSTGRSRYEELQVLVVYDKRKIGQWNASYVYSRSRGDLNTADRFFGDTPAFVVRPTEYVVQPFDAPHRFLMYGQIDVSKKYEIRLSPLFEIRSGFPFSRVNDSLVFVGPRNSAGRFPNYISLDLQATKRVKIPFVKDKHVRVGVVVLNLTDHFNPRDVQNNSASPNYGNFYNGLGRSFKAKFDFGN